MPDDPEVLHEYARLGVSRVLVPATAVTGLDSGIRGPEDVLKWKDTVARLPLSNSGQNNDGTH